MPTLNYRCKAKLQAACLADSLRGPASAGRLDHEHNQGAAVDYAEMDLQLSNKSYWPRASVSSSLAQATDTLQSINPDTIRSAIMQQQSPIHTYLFDAAGSLLLANLNAMNKWSIQGEY